MPEFLAPFLETLKNIASFWWVLLPILLFYGLAKVWLVHKREEFIKNIDWNLVEIRVPKEVETTPKAMEQVFAAMHAMYSYGIKGWDKWFKGEIERWVSFEFVGRAGGINFYVRLPKEFRNLLESAVYSQYPDAEISLVPESQDYVNHFPSDLPNEEFDIFGTEMTLKEDDGYPLRTYEYFEDVTDEKRLDPVSAIAETMSNLKDYESIWIQILIRPTGDDWIDEAEDLIEDIKKGEEGDDAEGFFEELWEWIKGFLIFMYNLLKAIVVFPVWPKDSDDDDDDDNGRLDPVQERKIEAIHEKTSKIGFESLIRFVYIDRKDDFTGENISSVMGSLKQFNTNTMNALQPNLSTMTIGKQPFKQWKVLHKKRKIYSNYRTRRFPGIQPSFYAEGDYSIFNVAELATMYHFPLTRVTLPQLRRTEIRQGGPPSDLPTFEDEPEKDE